MSDEGIIFRPVDEDPNITVDRLRQENKRLASDVDIIRSAVKEFDNQCKSLESTIQRHKDCLEVANRALDGLLENCSGNTIWNTKSQNAWWSARQAKNTINQLLEKKS